MNNYQAYNNGHNPQVNGYVPNRQYQQQPQKFKEYIGEYQTKYGLKSGVSSTGKQWNKINLMFRNERGDKKFGVFLPLPFRNSLQVEQLQEGQMYKVLYETKFVPGKINSDGTPMKSNSVVSITLMNNQNQLSNFGNTETKGGVVSNQTSSLVNQNTHVTPKAMVQHVSPLQPNRDLDAVEIKFLNGFIKMINDKNVPEDMKLEPTLEEFKYQYFHHMKTDNIERVKYIWSNWIEGMVNGGN